jgi:hypothetical protein
MKSQRTIFFPGVILILFGVVPALSAGSEGPNSLWAYRAAYWDGRYPSGWAGGGEAVRDTLEYAGYEILDANRLKVWMDARITDGLPSVVVFCRDIVPDTVAESMSFRCTLRRYLDAGGKIVWYADIPLYYQGHADGTRTAWGADGAINILGFNAAEGPWNSQTEVTFTADGRRWGLTQTWQSVRPTSGDGLRVLARDADGNAAAWVKHYLSDDTYRGFVRISDKPGEPNLDDLRRVAEYPHVPEPIAWDNQAESEDDIVGVFYYPWYENPNTSGRWRHWDGSGYSPPATWAACYLPNYPDSAWNPSVQLYDSKDTQVLRWQDRAMARAGVDIAVASWWGIGGYEDAGLAKAIRTCKSVQWCIYYEMEAYGDPAVQKIHDDIKYVLDSYGPTRNYARIDGKWLVLVYGAGGDETANRWRQAKALLAAHGYGVYLNGDKANGRDPWDAVHSYHPVVYQGYTHALPDVDDSAWIAPGFYGIADESPRLERSLSKFASAWNNIIANRNRCRFILVETWNEWHEGTSIEPGREIITDPRAFMPKPDGDYGYMFIDTIGPAAVNDLHWTSPGHRAVVPVRLEVEEMIWDDDRKVLVQSPTECRITEPDTRIGSSILVPTSGDAVVTVRARAVIQKAGRLSNSPELMLYLDDIEIQRWIVGPASYEDHSTTTPVPKGIHKLELAMAEEPVGTDWGIVVDFVDVNVVQTDKPSEEGFEAGNFGVFDWVTYGDAHWTAASTTSNSGSWSAQAGSINDSETATLELTLDCVAGEISFYCKVSCELGCDYLRFYIDGNKQDAWSGEEDWKQISFPVTAGRRTFRWEYSKDGSASSGADTAWIDDIAFPVK